MKNQNKTNYYEKRYNIRLKKVLKNVNKLILENKNKAVSAKDIYLRLKSNEYGFSFETLYRDLVKLEQQKLIIKEITYLGKGQGTKSLWTVPNLKQEK